MDVLARGNEALERLEQWEPFRRRYRQRAADNVRSLPARDRWDNIPDDVRDGLYYDLAGQPCGLRTWSRLWEDRFQATDVVRTDAGEVMVSTIWLGIDHSFRWPPGGPPIIYETMTFCEDAEKYDGEQWRYATREGALASHREITDQLAQSWWLNLGGRA